MRIAGTEALFILQTSVSVLCMFGTAVCAVIIIIIIDRWKR